MKLQCPQGHAAVVRHDPDSTMMRGQCDTCGWTAPYIVNRETSEFAPNGHGEELHREQLREQEERQRITAGGKEAQGSGQSRRRAD